MSESGEVWLCRQRRNFSQRVVFPVLQNGPGRKMGVVIQGTGRKRARLKIEKRRNTPPILE